MKNAKYPCTWKKTTLKQQGKCWYTHFKKRKRTASEFSPWWPFVYEWKNKLDPWLDAFIQGTYRFDPMQQIRFPDETVRMWGYRDRLILHLILNLVRPTFKHILSPLCFHMKGPSGVPEAISFVERALDSGEYAFALRIDIKSYYASIDHNILLTHIKQHFNDPRLLHYFDAIITTAVDDGGHVFQPKQGIPRGSSLSPFFGALYLSPLDQAFTNRTGMVYARYMDDCVILYASDNSKHLNQCLPPATKRGNPV